MGMSRHLRFVPDGGALVEVTCRTIQGRLLLRPSPQLNDIVLGVLGRAQDRYPVEVVSFSFLSSHYHLLLWVRDARELALFMGYFNGNLARKVGHLTGWTDKLWSRRYQAILVSDEEAAQVDRLTYILANGVKENLVARVEEWPGVHSGHALLTGDPVEGIWYDRTLARNLRLRRKTPEPGQVEIRQTVVLSQLPCWKHLTPNAYRTHPSGRSDRSDRGDRRGGEDEEGRGAARRGEGPGAGPGDPARDPGSLTGALHPRRDAKNPQGALGSLRMVYGRLP